LERHCRQLAEWYPGGWNYGHSTNGWTDDEHALKWLQRFEEQTRPPVFKRNERADRIQDDGISYRLNQRNSSLIWPDNIEPAHYCLLLFDGYASYLIGEFVAYALEHKIVLCCLPPHTSHYLQPLDVGVFTHAKRRYRMAVQERAERGWTTMKRDNFLPLYAELRPNNLNSSTIMDGWKQTGIRPVSLDVLERHFKDQNVNITPRKLQTLQVDNSQQLDTGPDEGLQIQSTGVGTTQSAVPTASLFIKHGRAVSINPYADYHEICAQIPLEKDPERLNTLIQALKSWCERKEIETKAFKITAHLFYESALQNKKNMTESSSRSHLGLCQTIDQEGWRARQDRLQKEEEAKEQAKLTKAAITAQKRTLRAAQIQTPPPKRRRVAAGASQLSLTVTLDDIDPVLRQVSPAPSLASIASLGLDALSHIESQEENYLHHD